VPTITLKDQISGIDTRLSAMPGRLRAAGVEPPAALVDGLAAARWATSTPDRADAVQRLSAAKTEADFQTALVALAEVDLLAAAVGSKTVQDAARGFRQSAALAGFAESRDSLIETVVADYNRLAPGFTAALAELPDVTEIRSPFDITPDASAALRAAKDHADRMSALLDVYRDIAGLIGAPVSGPLATAAALADYSDGAQMARAAEMITAYKDRDPTGFFGPLSPHSAPVSVGATLGLVSPFEAAERLDRIQSGRYYAEDREFAGFSDGHPVAPLF